MLPNRPFHMRFLLPVLLGGAVTLAGCYTMLTHPQAELTAGGHGEDYGDCASCHATGFEKPVYSDPYLHYSDVWWSYYGCPWWVVDCGSGIEGSGQYGGGGAAEDGDDPARGRFIGGRGGAVSGFRAAPPPMSGPRTVGVGAPGAPNSAPSDAETGTTDKRIKKKGKKDAGPDAGDKGKEKDEPTDTPADDPPPGGGR